ncbi:MAG: putative Cytoplasmic dynein 1 heavy chain 1, partial [Streblomastix strix]
MWKQARLPMLQQWCGIERESHNRQLIEFEKQYHAALDEINTNSTISSQHALDLLINLEQNIEQLSEQGKSLDSRLQYLGMEPLETDQLTEKIAAIAEVKQVWERIQGLTSKLDAVRAMLLSQTKGREVRLALDTLMTEAKQISEMGLSKQKGSTQGGFNSKVTFGNYSGQQDRGLQDFEAYKSFVLRVRKHIDGCVLLEELVGETMKKRHWDEIARRVEATCLFGGNYVKCTVGQILDCCVFPSAIPSVLKQQSEPQLSNYKSTQQQMQDENSRKRQQTPAEITKEVVTRAQGEYALECFLNQLRDRWAGEQFETVDFRRRCRVIKGWDSLFEKLGEDLAQVEAMKYSPFQAAFASESLQWSERLVKLQSILDLWRQVQQKWVDLEAVFGVGSSLAYDGSRSGPDFGDMDIMAQLQQHTVRYRAADKEFIALAKEVLGRQMALVANVESIPSISQILERLLQELETVQKGLAQFLESQRNNFGRFYFVGDEDLLEIIGAGKDASKVQRHLRKLFAGIYLLLVKEKAIQDQGSKEMIKDADQQKNQNPQQQVSQSNEQRKGQMVIDQDNNEEQQNDKQTGGQSNQKKQKQPQIIEQILVGFSSREGESVPFSSPFSLNGFRQVHQWLQQVETQMRSTLANKLIQTISQFEELSLNINTISQPTQQTPQNLQTSQKTSARSTDQLSRYVNAQPDMLLLLCLNIYWTNAVERILTSANQALSKANQISTAQILNPIEGNLSKLLQIIASILRHSTNLPHLLHGKLKHFITELVHLRDETRRFISENITSPFSYTWLSEMRTYFDPIIAAGVQPMSSLTVTIGDATLFHSLEYQGAQERLVHTALTSQCYAILAQALKMRLGGSPFGPAGTGKTETVKALGAELGRHVLVFNCDEHFDFGSVGRILVGLCRCGAWGCFDEFNRLEARMLSAVSQQIQAIQLGLQSHHSHVELLEHRVPLHENVGIFVTMNPGYAGRTTLPDNLKALFRSVAMVVPDRQQIASVMLFSQGFHNAEELAIKIVPLYKLLEEQLSKQPHYDFGLRALKSTLISAGSLMKTIGKKGQKEKFFSKTQSLTSPQNPQSSITNLMSLDQPEQASSLLIEKTLLVRCIVDTVAPKLLSQDVGLFHALLNSVFPAQSSIAQIHTNIHRNKEALSPIPLSAHSSMFSERQDAISPFPSQTPDQYQRIPSPMPQIPDMLTQAPQSLVSAAEDEELRQIAKYVCNRHFLVPSDQFIEKLVQLYHIQAISHGFMLVGASGVGKTCTWRVLTETMDLMKEKDWEKENAQLMGDQILHQRKPKKLSGGSSMRTYTIDPKAMSKEELYGTMDPASHEWNDGVFTRLMRNIIESASNEQNMMNEQEIRNESNDNQEGNEEANQNQFSSYFIPTNHWIIFDGDVDPEWVENLNSVLDDNKLLTLPNGERLPLPPSTRIVFEVQDLKAATPATVSRCGIVWLNDGHIQVQQVAKKMLDMLWENPISQFLNQPAAVYAFPAARDDKDDRWRSGSGQSDSSALKSQNTLDSQLQQGLGTLQASPTLITGRLIQQKCAEMLHKYCIGQESVLEHSLLYGMENRSASVMNNYDPFHALNSVFSLIFSGIQQIIDYYQENPQTLFTDESLSRFIQYTTAYSLCWGVAGPLPLELRYQLSDRICKMMNITDIYNTKEGMDINSKQDDDDYIIEDKLQNSDNNYFDQLETKQFLDYEILAPDGNARPWRAKVPSRIYDPDEVGSSDLIIPTIDTERHEALIKSLISTGKPLILCGPPGSGKTMLLMHCLSSMPECEVVNLSFSSATKEDVILKSILSRCTLFHTPECDILRPNEKTKLSSQQTQAQFNAPMTSSSQSNYTTATPGTSKKQKLIIFCDEINLPSADKYGTQRVIQLLREIVEKGGIWHPQTQRWLKLENILIVAACNPPTDAGRIPLPWRFLRHVSLLFIDFPSAQSLYTIYSTCIRSLLRPFTQLGKHSENLTKTVIQVFDFVRTRFTSDQQPHYIFSPRDLTRFVRALKELLFNPNSLAIFTAKKAGKMSRRKKINALSLAYDEAKYYSMKKVIIPFCGHQVLRLFQDRLVTPQERSWLDTYVDDCFNEHFKNEGYADLGKPFLFSSLDSSIPSQTDRSELRTLIAEKLRRFAEEELDVKLVLFDAVLDHILRIDSVLRQVMGHMLLIGASGAGKTVLSKFVAWNIGMSVQTIHLSRRYTIENFEDDCRTAMWTAGVRGEQICFLLNEANVLESSYLERINALLACGDIPGLFTGEAYSKLLIAIRDVAKTVGSSSAMVAVKGQGNAQKGIGPQIIKKKSMIDLGDENQYESDLILQDTLSISATDEEAYNWFIRRVQRNLHVVLTMNPASSEYADRTATSPALFNRCVIDWMGDWEPDALLQVSFELIASLDIDGRGYSAPTQPGDDQMQLQSLGKKKKKIRAQSSLKRQNSILLSPSNLDLGGGIAFDENFFNLPVPQNMYEAACRVLVEMHLAVEKENEILRKRGLLQNFATPRHYIDFIEHFKTIMSQRKEKVTDQQHHLGTGLGKLEEARTSVGKMEIELSQTQTKLVQSEAQMNNMTGKLVDERAQIATKAKESQIIKNKLDIQIAEINKNKEQANGELRKVEPILQQAKNNVGTVKKDDMNKVKSYPNPPAMIQSTVTATLFLLTGKLFTWESFKKTAIDITKEIQNFNNDQLLNDPKRAEEVKKNCAQVCNAKEEDFKHSSETIRMLGMWVKAQMSYTEVVRKVEPIRQIVQKLESDQQKQQEKQQVIVQELETLRRRESETENQLKRITADIERIRLQKNQVSEKVIRCQKLLQSLSSERERWAEEKGQFDSQGITLCGDSLLSAGFLAYAGFFDDGVRSRLLHQWGTILNRFNIPVDQNYQPQDALSTEEERAEWASLSLSTDQLSIENAIILRRFRRFPLVVDPSGQAVDFITALFKSSGINTTSFLSPTMLKELETSLRFGTPLLITDAEHSDPVLHPLLNKEFRRVSGRMMVQLDKNQIDVSPKFQLFLSTAVPAGSLQLSPDMCSRVTVANFTVTMSSLAARCMSRIVAVERPEVGTQRAQISKARGEDSMRLHDVERKLLQALSGTSTSIIDDTKVVNTLESLKKDAANIRAKVAMQDSVMDELVKAQAMYTPLSQACSRVFFLMEQLIEIHQLYQFSLRHFFTVLDLALAAGSMRVPLLKKENYNQEANEEFPKSIEKSHSNSLLPIAQHLSNSQQKLKLAENEIPQNLFVRRLIAITQRFFCEIFQQVGRSLFQQHRTLFALQIAYIAVELEWDIQTNIELLLLYDQEGGFQCKVDEIGKTIDEWSYLALDLSARSGIGAVGSGNEPLTVQQPSIKNPRERNRSQINMSSLGRGMGTTAQFLAQNGGENFKALGMMKNQLVKSHQRQRSFSGNMEQDQYWDPSQRLNSEQGSNSHFAALKKKPMGMEIDEVELKEEREDEGFDQQTSEKGKQKKLALKPLKINSRKAANENNKKEESHHMQIDKVGDHYSQSSSTGDDEITLVINDNNDSYGDGSMSQSDEIDEDYDEDDEEREKEEEEYQQFQKENIKNRKRMNVIFRREQLSLQLSKEQEKMVNLFADQLPLSVNEILKQLIIQFSQKSTKLNQQHDFKFQKKQSGEQWMKWLQQPQPELVQAPAFDDVDDSMKEENEMEYDVDSNNSQAGKDGRRKSKLSQSSDLSQISPPSQQQKTTVLAALRHVLILRLARPDRFIAAVRVLIQSVFSHTLHFMDKADSGDLQRIAEVETTPTTPILLLSPSGHDPSDRVENASRDMNISLTSIAMGSSECTELAKTALINAATKGAQALSMHQQFPMFSTSQINNTLLLNQIQGERGIKTPRGDQAGLNKSKIQKRESSFNMKSQQYVGYWVILKNVHLAPGWLKNELPALILRCNMIIKQYAPTKQSGQNNFANSKVQDALNSTQQQQITQNAIGQQAFFRIILTADLDSQLPPSILRESQRVVLEPIPGLRAGLLHALKQDKPNVLQRLPNERSRLHLLVAWLHAVVCERLRYAPIGWCKKYEFSSGDLIASYDLVDIWLNTGAVLDSNYFTSFFNVKIAASSSKISGQQASQLQLDPSKLKQSISPADIPFKAIHAVIGALVYGGKIDNDCDKRILLETIQRIFIAPNCCVDNQQQKQQQRDSNPFIKLQLPEPPQQLLPWDSYDDSIQSSFGTGNSP